MITFAALWKLVLVALLAAALFFLVSHVGRSVNVELGRFAKLVEVGNGEPYGSHR